MNQSVHVNSIYSQSRRRYWGLGGTLVVSLAARITYYYLLGIRFDASGLPTYLQFIDPELLKNRLLESIFYLREQPPLFNLFLGLVLKAAPNSYVPVFHFFFVLTGLVLAASLYWMLTGIGLPILPAAIATSIYMVHPATILYENWLIYEYPVTAMLILAALLLHVYVARGTSWAGHGFFVTLAMIVLMRGTFHFVWMLGTVAGVALLPTTRFRTTAKCGAIPLVLVSAFYVKHYALFGEFVSGGVYRKLNYSMMRTAPLPYDELVKLAEQRKISSVSILPVFGQSVPKYQPFLPPPRDTGVALLDQITKSSGAANWHHYAMPLVADLYFRNAQVLDALRPDLYRTSLASSAYWYFKPANENMALYDPPTQNVKRLDAWLRWTNRILAGQFVRGGCGWIIVVVLPLSLIYGIAQTLRGVIGRIRGQPTSTDSAGRLAVIAFCTFTTLYISIATILLSYADQNRYRSNLMPLFLVLVAAMFVDGLRMIKQSRMRQPAPAARAANRSARQIKKR